MLPLHNSNPKHFDKLAASSMEGAKNMAKSTGESAHKTVAKKIESMKPQMPHDFPSNKELSKKNFEKLGGINL